MANKLTLKQEAFIAAYLETGNATAAYRRAYNCSKWTDAAINTAAYKLTKNAQVALRIKDYRATAAADVVASVGDVLKKWVTIVTADRRELMTHRRVNCRHCWGKNHFYQWKSLQEFSDELERVAVHNSRCNLRNKMAPQVLPSDAGGIGFKRNRSPHPDCPECDGEGYAETFVADFKDLSPAAQLLYAGLKVTKEGIEVKMMDKDRALDNLAKALGVLKPDGAGVTINNIGPTVQAAEVVPTDPNDAAKFYRDFMSKS